MRFLTGFTVWIKKKLPQIWYGKGLQSLIWAWVFFPLTFIFCAIVRYRRRWYRHRSQRLKVPVIIVGNITIGGSGKTPMVIFLAHQLQSMGLLPGIVSRGFGSYAVHARYVDSLNADAFGDEAVLIAQETACPVAVGTNRCAAAHKLLALHHCNVIISDDGLQHYRLFRDLEIILVDGIRKFGNGYCLPSGPLREKPKRLDDADFVLALGGGLSLSHDVFELKPDNLINLRSGDALPLTEFKGQQVNAVAGIADPERFFLLLEQWGLLVCRHSFPDHHHFQSEDFNFASKMPVVMTQKDAIKCQSIATEKFWYLRIRVEVSKNFMDNFREKVAHFNIERRVNG